MNVKRNENNEQSLFIHDYRVQGITGDWKRARKLYNKMKAKNMTDKSNAKEAADAIVIYVITSGKNQDSLEERSRVICGIINSITNLTTKEEALRKIEDIFGGATEIDYIECIAECHEIAKKALNPTKKGTKNDKP